MSPFFIGKFFISAAIIAIASEVAKRSGWMGGLIASIPLVSVLTFVVLYLETHDIQKICDVSYGVLVFNIPSIVLFLCLPFLLQRGLPFWGALGLSFLATAIAYGITSLILNKFGLLNIH